MAQRRGSFPVTRGRKARLTDWAVGPGGTAETAISSSQTVILGSGVSSTIGKFTIVRTRGEFSGRLITAAAASNGFSGAIGIGIVTDQAFGIGLTAVPKPVSDSAWDGWLYHRFFTLMSAGVIDGGVVADHDVCLSTSGAFRFEVDSKAMRIIDEEETLTAIVQVTEIGTATGGLMFDSRMLAKLG